MEYTVETYKLIGPNFFIHVGLLSAAASGDSQFKIHQRPGKRIESGNDADPLLGAPFTLSIDAIVLYIWTFSKDRTFLPLAN